jgi:hypothetical protein
LITALRVLGLEISFLTTVPFLLKVMCLPLGAQLQHPADRVVVIHHTCGPRVALSRLSHESPPIEGGAR